MLLLLALLLSACGQTTGPNSGSAVTQARVELDIFSGRPNPEWRLPETDTAQFKEKLAALPVATPGQLANPLGYRGFIVHLGETTVTVQNGLVRTTRAGEMTYHKDPYRVMEQWLLNTGRPFLDEEIFNVVKRELPA
ncbi:hypothetical protein JOF56_010906 [Kibdelosporangium banguiense]|uniref:Uncharacterized protein n=1 Tax=Kibdelosporangium banguiense TaxID=1365924 RepID=A0ABS4U2V7_9PSEU|nr:hypothetical protein [Kibdelosporangium banguiense]MBP2330521.1 hypothetical protein [Kibdelosporangium banguiense]